MFCCIACPNVHTDICARVSRVVKLSPGRREESHLGERECGIMCFFWCLFLRYLPGEGTCCPSHKLPSIPSVFFIAKRLESGTWEWDGQRAACPGLWDRRVHVSVRGSISSPVPCCAGSLCCRRMLNFEVLSSRTVLSSAVGTSHLWLSVSCLCAYVPDVILNCSSH